MRKKPIDFSNGLRYGMVCVWKYFFNSNIHNKLPWDHQPSIDLYRNPSCLPLINQQWKHQNYKTFFFPSTFPVGNYHCYNLQWHSDWFEARITSKSRSTQRSYTVVLTTEAGVLVEKRNNATGTRLRDPEPLIEPRSRSFISPCVVGSRESCILE